MPTPQPPDSAPTGYFLLRIRREPAPDGVSGVVERLGTGEKRAFHSSRELADVVAAWPD